MTEQHNLKTGHPREMGYNFQLTGMVENSSDFLRNCPYLRSQLKIFKHSQVQGIIKAMEICLQIVSHPRGSKGKMHFC